MSFVLLRAETLINELLQTDEALLQDVVAMADKVMAIELSGLDKTLYILPIQDGLRLQMDYNGDVHVRIKGTPIALLKMARQQQQTGFNGEVEISGDLGLGQHLQQMIGRLDLDWEELLSHKIGDVAAHQIGNALRSFTRWARDAHEGMEQNMGDYLRIESELAGNRNEVELFIDDVERLRSDVDRLEQRITRLGR